jgi:hypothetical protein
MRECRRCGGEVDRMFRFCPWCSEAQRLKLVEFFRPHPALRDDSGKALRVSRYLAPVFAEQHARFSVWSDTDDAARAEAAVSLDDEETSRLAHFLLDSRPRPRRPRLRDVVRAQLRDCVRR